MSDPATTAREPAMSGPTRAEQGLPEHYPGVDMTGRNPATGGPMYVGRCACGWRTELRTDADVAKVMAEAHAWPDGHEPAESIAAGRRLAQQIADILAGPPDVPEDHVTDRRTTS